MIVRKPASYADTLRNIKEAIITTGKQNQIKSVKETKEGNLLFEIKEESHADELREMISRVAEDVRTLNKYKNNEVLHIKTLDALATEEEVRKAVSQQLKGKEPKVVSLRPTYGKTQAATIITSNENAMILEEVGSINVGISECNIQIRERLKTCYRCWGAGHLAKDCAGSDRSELCKKCGHRANNCTNSPRCPICDKGGHEASMMRWPKYRKWTAEAKRARTDAAREEAKKTEDE